MKKNSGLVFLLLLTAIMAGACSSGSGSGSDDGSDSTTTTGNTLTITSGDYSQLGSSDISGTTLGISGGSLDVTSGSLSGLKIQAAAAATDETISFTISYTDVSSITGLPSGASVASPLVKIATSGSASWNEYMMFNSGVAVTIPLNTSALASIAKANSSSHLRVGVYTVNANGTIDDTGYANLDATNNRVTFVTRSFANTSPTSPFSSTASAQIAGRSRGTMTKGLSDSFWNAYAANTPSSTFRTYVAIAYAIPNGTTIDSSFRPGTDGFYIPNVSSIPSMGGNCLGMSSFARFYYRYMGKESAASRLYIQFRDSSNSSSWQDDSTAIELATRAQLAEQNIWNEYNYEELDFQNPNTISMYEVAYSWAGAMSVTGIPVIAALNRLGANRAVLGAHAVLIYKIVIDDSGNMTFYVYDPNYPNEEKTFTYLAATGFQEYTTADRNGAVEQSYNYFRHIGFQNFVNEDTYRDLLMAALSDFTNSSIFPTISITSITGKNNGENVLARECTESTTERHCYQTSDTSVTIAGTVTGTQEAMDNTPWLSVFLGSAEPAQTVLQPSAVGDGTYTASFSGLEVPVPQGGYSELAIVASNAMDTSGWGGYWGDVIYNANTPSPLTVTLTWDQGSATDSASYVDVDLYVKEPNFTKNSSSYTGDTVFYSHRKGESATHPYLDFDNTTGYGPEHYIAPAGTSTLATDGSTENPDGVFGSYIFKVHYYSGSVPVTYHLNWSYCPLSNASSCTSSDVISGNSSGALASSSSSNCCDINHTGADWSDAQTLTITSVASESSLPITEAMLP